MSERAGIIVLPGSNREFDLKSALQSVGYDKVDLLYWHTTDLSGYDLLLLPGGFSYGDYLRSGAIAKCHRVMQELLSRESRGVKVLGICNGFQILTELGLLEGSLNKNQNLRFNCGYVNVQVRQTNNIYTRFYEEGVRITLPIANNEGEYYADSNTIKRLQDENRIVFEYVDKETNSVTGIAGIINKKGNVLGLMPHLENAVRTIDGSQDGRFVFQSLLQGII